MRSRSRWVAILGVGLILLGLTGCWDDEPDTVRASTIMLTVSRTSQPREWQWQFYFPNPTVTVSSLSQLKPSEQLYSTAVTAPSLYDASTKVQQRLARDLYLGQLEVIVLSRSLTTQNLARLLNAYNREGLTPKTAYVLIASSPPKMALVTPQEAIPSIFWGSYFDCKQCQPEFLARPEWQVWDNFMTPGTSPTIPYGTSTFELSQIAVYPHKGLPIIFSRKQTRGWAYLMGRSVKESLALHTSQGIVTLGQIHGTAHTRAMPGDNRIRVAVKINLVASLAEWSSMLKVTPQKLTDLEVLAEHSVLSDCLDAIQKANMTHTDPFNFGRALYFQHEASTTLIQGRWEPLEVNVTVTMQIRSTGSGV